MSTQSPSQASPQIAFVDQLRAVADPVRSGASFAHHPFSQGRFETSSTSALVAAPRIQAYFLAFEAHQGVESGSLEQTFDKVCLALAS